MYLLFFGGSSFPFDIFTVTQKVGRDAHFFVRLFDNFKKKSPATDNRHGVRKGEYYVLHGISRFECLQQLGKLDSKEIHHFLILRPTGIFRKAGFKQKSVDDLMPLVLTDLNR